jgi:hypothetical protein
LEFEEGIEFIVESVGLLVELTKLELLVVTPEKVVGFKEGTELLVELLVELISLELVKLVVEKGIELLVELTRLEVLLVGIEEGIGILVELVNLEVLMVVENGLEGISSGQGAGHCAEQNVPFMLIHDHPPLSQQQWKEIQGEEQFSSAHV